MMSAESHSVRSIQLGDRGKSSAMATTNLQAFLTLSILQANCFPLCLFVQCDALFGAGKVSLRS